MISGDINADTEDIATLADMLEREGSTDIGAHAHRWGARSSEATCWAPNSGLEGTRRDVMFVNAQLLPFVVGFGVCPLDELPTHATLQVFLRKPADDYVPTKSIKPPSLNRHFDAKLKEIQDERGDGEGEGARPKTDKDKAGCGGQLIEKLHANMDRLIAANAYNIDRANARWDSTGAWRRIAKCIELGFIDALELDECTAKKLKGHGKPKI